jgi:hypothetical protein
MSDASFKLKPTRRGIVILPIVLLHFRSRLFIGATNRGTLPAWLHIATSHAHHEMSIPLRIFDDGLAGHDIAIHIERDELSKHWRKTRASDCPIFLV